VLLAVRNLNHTYITKHKADETVHHQHAYVVADRTVLGWDKMRDTSSVMQMHYKRSENSFEDVWDESREDVVIVARD